MSAELLLLRHGKSDWRVNTGDFNRPLKKRGINAAKKMGLWLQARQYKLDMVISSPAVRAMQSAQLLLQAMNMSEQLIVAERRIYEADTSTLKQVLEQCPETTHQLLMVGHNPGLENLLLNLADSNVEIPDDGKLLPTATLAHLRIPGFGKKLTVGCAQLISITRAADLA